MRKQNIDSQSFFRKAIVILLTLVLMLSLSAQSQKIARIQGKDGQSQFALVQEDMLYILKGRF